MISTRLKTETGNKLQLFPFFANYFKYRKFTRLCAKLKVSSANISQNTNMFLELPFSFLFCIIWQKTLKFYDCGHGKILMSVLETYSPTKYFSNFLSLEFTLQTPLTFTLDFLMRRSVGGRMSFLKMLAKWVTEDISR